MLLRFQDRIFYKRKMDVKVVSTTVDFILFIWLLVVVIRNTTIPVPGYRMYHVSDKDG